ncbi:MAG: SAM-dependent methyltransferase [Deltaproteobacteria bacterium]|nr:MAG: SAM-dependent methyltransferase [Deltaproteobacteria bacterium]
MPTPDGIIRPARRPPGWSAPGPRPAGLVHPDLRPGPREDLCFLTGDWRILQRVDGHRWSLDDLVTAWVAVTSVPEDPGTHVDLGCGIGSVLMMVAWAFPRVRSLGVEAQPLSAALARRSLRYNGAADRVAVLERDHRRLGREEVARRLSGRMADQVGVAEPFAMGRRRADEASRGDVARGSDLVTGTPPYFAQGAATAPAGVQREACRFTVRGGMEDYVSSAVRIVSPEGRVVLCGAIAQYCELERSAAKEGWGLVRRVTVVPREGKEPLLFVAVLAAGARSTREDTLVVRDARGQWTPSFVALRERMGMPPAPSRAGDRTAG